MAPHPVGISSIRIIPFEPEHQYGIDAFMTEIQKEYQECFTVPGSLSISELSKKQHERYWVALCGDVPVGTIGLSGFDDQSAVIKRLFLARSFRGKPFSIAERLLQQVIAEAGRGGMACLYLGTMAQFEGAKKFYTKKGFVQIRKDQLPEGMKLSVLDTVFYKLALHQAKRALWMDSPG